MFIFHARKEKTMLAELIWQSSDAPGFEHVRIDAGHPEWTVFDSMFVREHEGQVRRGGYTLIVDKAWRTLEIRIMVEQAPGSMIAQHLLASGDGTWTDAENHPIPELEGCIDVDIQWSPLTNTLPTRRLELQPGQATDIRVVYVALPDFGIRPMAQTYSRVDAATVRYESESRSFVRDLVVDDEGYVIDYPGLFQRTWPLPPDTSR
jgi:hypothetical protein